jgi:tRNA(Ile)-lysidine synthase
LLRRVAPRNDNPRSASPLTPAELDASLAAIGGFETRPLIAVAVSGGPDSMALMLLADRWARRQGGLAWGLTVDHGLRLESADEARIVASWLAAHAIPHRILRWDGPKPGSGIQEAAREARYRLLAGWCRKQGCLHLFTAHHLQDQIETHLIRRRAGSGVEGLAGMSAVRDLEGCRLVRPLLAVCRDRMGALLDAEGQKFLHDPSNLNPVFERARLRLDLVEETSLVPKKAAEVRAYARERTARGQALDRLIARAVWLHPAGFGVLDPAVLAAADRETGTRLLSRVVLCLGGLRYPARTARLTRLLMTLLREPGRACTLGGCRFVPWRGRLLVLRELAAAEKPIALEPGADLRWDRRFAVSLSLEAAGGFMLGYLWQYGRQYGRQYEDARRESGFGRMLPPLVHSVMPAFWDAEGVACVPYLGYARPGSPVPPLLSFRPVRTLSSPGFTVV